MTCLTFSTTPFDFVATVAGYEVLVMILQLMLGWNISVVAKTVKSFDDVQPMQGLTIQPTSPKMKFEPRNNG